MTAATKPDYEPRAASSRQVSEQERQDFRRLAEAFATLFELSAYLPSRLVHNLGDEYLSVINGVNSFDPDVIRATFPTLAELGCLNYAAEEGSDEDESQS